MLCRVLLCSLIREGRKRSHLSTIDFFNSHCTLSLLFGATTFLLPPTTPFVTPHPSPTPVLPAFHSFTPHSPSLPYLLLHPISLHPPLSLLPPAPPLIQPPPPPREPQPPPPPDAALASVSEQKRIGMRPPLIRRPSFFFRVLFLFAAGRKIIGLAGFRGAKIGQFQ